MFRYKGYTGKFLRVNLSKGKIKKEELSNEVAKSFIGGIGVAARILFDEIDKSTKPLSPDSKLIVTTGPITGTFFPPSGRFAFIAKSPLTGIWGESHCGGHFGPELKYAGFDFIILEGRAKKPVYLWVNDGSAEIRDATGLWGKNTAQTTNGIREILDDKNVKVCCIGPAGENAVKYSCIITDFYRAAGRGGMGAVMGSKNLKAIAVRGSGSVEVANPDRFFETASQAYDRIVNEWGEICENSLGGFGTPNLVEAINEIGRFPTKNHWTGFYENADKIGAIVLKNRYRKVRDSCLCCGIQCKYISHVKSGPFKGTITGGPEYESIMAFGSNCLNDDVESVIYMNSLCNLYGLDTISTGKAISFAMECFEKGILTERDVGFRLDWGNTDSMIKMMGMIAHRKDIGDILAEGVRKAAKKIGKGSERYAMHVKGMEISAQDGRAHQSSGLTHATGPRGADHLRSLSCLEERGYRDTAIKRFGADRVEEVCNPISTKYKGLIIKDMEDLYVIVDSLIVCKYGTMWPPILYFDDFARIIPPLTGIAEYSSVKELRKTAERIVNLRKAFNAREGLTRKDDTLPKRFLKDPMPTGPAKGHVVRLKPMLDEYYELMGWDKKTGLPKRQTLERVGLKDVAKKLKIVGKVIE